MNAPRVCVAMVGRMYRSYELQGPRLRTGEFFTAKHIGMNGNPCHCTPARRRRSRIGCDSVCWCHNVSHRECPNAHPCLGGCGRMTTAGESTACGYCLHCAADSGWHEIT